MIDIAEEIFAAWTGDECVEKYTSWYAHGNIEDDRCY